MNPPRALFLDFPLGHTAGKPNDKAGQRRILAEALNLIESAQVPGQIKISKEQWSADDVWKDGVMRPKSDASAQAEHNDDRVERHDTPQYQSAADAEIADPDCASCVWLE